MSMKALTWDNGVLTALDQTLLPTEERFVHLDSVASVWEAIKSLRVRGAPLIGVTAAFGVLVALDEAAPQTPEAARDAVREATDYLATSRPTAVNLFYALDRMRAAVDTLPETASAGEMRARLEEEALAIQRRENENCRAIGEHGAALLGDGDGVLTHCNAGGLATGEYGTALAVMFSAHEQGRRFQVFADETRPLLQGARLTTWELMQAGIDVTLICDNTAAQVMREGKVQLVVTGADRIAANGDAANKIGTYSVAQLAHVHGIPFYVAAPWSTFDLSLESGALIPIELRGAEEVTCGFGCRTAPEGVKVYSPAFDVTPAELIAGIVTETGIVRPPYRENIARMAAAAGLEGQAERHV